MKEDTFEHNLNNCPLTMDDAENKTTGGKYVDV